VLDRPTLNVSFPLEPYRRLLHASCRHLVTVAEVEERECSEAAQCSQPHVRHLDAPAEAESPTTARSPVSVSNELHSRRLREVRDVSSATARDPRLLPICNH
jgi:hypothetical protein